MAVTIPIGVQAAAGSAGNVFGTEAKIQLAANATRVLGHGVTASAAGSSPAVMIVFTSANDIVRFSPDAGTTWRTLVPAASAGMVLCDGLGNVQILNEGVADAGAVYTYVYEAQWIA